MVGWWQGHQEKGGWKMEGGRGTSQLDRQRPHPIGADPELRQLAERRAEVPAGGGGGGGCEL